MIRSEIQTAAARQDSDGWRALLKLLCDPALPAAQRVVEVAWLHRELAAWPPEVSRPPPSPVKLAEARRALMRGQGPHDSLHWAQSVLRDLAPICRVVRETDLYPLFIERICGSERLLLRDGSQAVHLHRAFVGSLAERRVGQVGQADLAGGLTVEWWHCFCGDRDCMATSPEESGIRRGEWRHVEIRLEVEVKTDAGELSDAQEKRQAAFARRGGIYVVARRVAEAIDLICAERDRVLSEIVG